METIAALIASLAGYIPLGFIGLWRWFLFGFKKSVATGYHHSPALESLPPVSLIVPIYNERPDILKQAFATWIANGPMEIIAIVDATDHASIGIVANYKTAHPDLIRIRITYRPGKREALADGIRASRGDILVLADSDTVWELNLLRKLLGPFTDQRVGAVAPRQELAEARTFVQKAYQFQLAERFDTELPFLDVLGDALTCVSGRTAAYRREAIIGLVDELENETFAGEKCISGDDKCLTRLVERDRWKVRYQRSAVVYTYGAPDLRTYLKQRLRWTRNSWRSDLLSLSDPKGWIWEEKALAFHMIDRFMQPFALLLGPLYLGLFLVRGHFHLAGILIAWWLVSRAIKLGGALRRSPGDLRYLPAYIVMVYVVGVLKVYALFSLTSQGWKTRWHTDRLEKSGVGRVLAPAGITALMLGMLMVGAVSFEQFAIGATSKEKTVPEEHPYDFAALLDEVIEEINTPGFVSYRPLPDETLRSIGRKFNLSLTDLQHANRGIKPSTRLSGQLIRLPVVPLRNPWRSANLKSEGTPTVTYIPPGQGRSPIEEVKTHNIIMVTGPGTTITLPELAQILHHQYPTQPLLTRHADGTWHLTASISLGSDVILIIASPDVERLAMESSPQNFTWIAAYDGGILIEDTSITSWDSQAQAPDTTTKDGRSFILVKNSGRMDVIGAEIAYLGYSTHFDTPRSFPSGGVYGLSWRIPTDYFEKSVVTGVVQNSSMHHNEFGIFTYGAIGMDISGNTVYENNEYGIDPHDDSNYLSITGNTVYGNGNHGIIISKRCSFNVIARNQTYRNAAHGIILDRDSNRNLVENNESFENQDGIAVYDSHENVIRTNRTSHNTKNGIRLNVFASRNLISENTIVGNPKGIFIYGHARQNLLLGNTITQNNLALSLRNTSFIHTDTNVFDENERLIDEVESVGNRIDFLPVPIAP